MTNRSFRFISTAPISTGCGRRDDNVWHRPIAVLVVAQLTMPTRRPGCPIFTSSCPALSYNGCEKPVPIFLTLWPSTP